MQEDKITFSFGENWQNFLGTVDQEVIDKAKHDIELWLDKDFVAGKTVLDIGSGSGIHSLAFHQLGAKSVHSFDYDPNSVAATTLTRQRTGNPANWTVCHGSILDKEYLKTFRDGFDIVYSWGVLHHTGSMWEAVDNSIRLVRPGGKLWISLYAKGARYSKDLTLKQQYNAASQLGKHWMIGKKIAKLMVRRALALKNPFGWNEKKYRGMNVYHDLIDWYGGLPYEVASEDEVVRVGRKYGLVLERIYVEGEGSCNCYVFSAPARSLAKAG